MPSALQTLDPMKLVKRAAIAAMATSVLLLAGCSLSPTDTATTTVVPSFGGSVHGGQSPIQAATVNLYLTDPAATGYGTSALKISSTTSDANGNFKFPTSISSTNCTAGQQAYVTSSGGYPPGQPTILNNAILLTAALGDCTKISSTTFVTVNELTTVAFAYALSGFTSTTTQGSGYTAIVSAPPQNSAVTPSLTLSTTNPGGVYSGLQHAFLNALSLVNLNGGANATTTASTGGTTVAGSIPVAFLNTLADIMQFCVNSGNSTGAVDAQCTTLFNGTPSISGALATNTLQAFINLARNPGSTASLAPNTGIMNYSPSNGAFAPALTVQPNDWALTISYNAASGVPITTLPKPFWLALDANDTVYFGGSAAASLTGVSPYGASVPAFTAGSGSASHGIATDLLGNIWLNNASTTLYRYSLASGGAAAGTYTTLATSYGTAIDKQNNIWVAHGVSTTDIDEFNYISSTSTWATTANYTATTGYSNYGIAIDANQNVWVAPYTSTTSVYVLANIGTTAAPNYTASGSTITPIAGTLQGAATKPYGVSFDVNGNAWYGIYGTPPSASLAGIEEFVPNSTSALTSIAGQTFIPGTQAGAGSSSGNTLGVQVTNLNAMDGSETLFLPDNNGSNTLHVFSTTTGRVISPTAGLVGCYLSSAAPTVCGSGTSTGAIYNPRAPVIDSTGTVWAGNTNGGVTQIIGLAAPTYPVLAVGQPGLSPGLTAANPLP